MPPASARTSADPALLASALLLRLGYAILTIAVPVTASFSRRAIFVLLPFGTAMILIAALIVPPNGGGGRLRREIVSPIGIAVLVLALWATLSLLWSPVPVDAAQRLFKLLSTLALTAGGVALLPPRMRVSSIYLLPIGLALAIVNSYVLTIVGVRVTASPETDAFTLERATITIMILVWPALAALCLRTRWFSATALALGAIAAAVATGNAITILGVSIGIVSAVGAHYSAKITGTVLMILVLALFLFAPLLPFIIELVTSAFTRSPPEWLTPIMVWQNVVADDVPRLLTGHGLETSGHGIAAGLLPPRTPRSVLFQIWYELGLVGAFATAFCLARGFFLASRSPTAPFLVGAFATATTLAVFSKNFEQIWWVCLLGVAAVCFAGVLNAQYRTARPTVLPPLNPTQSRRPKLP